MESQELIYCLNPCCLHNQQRVFMKEKKTEVLHNDCGNWIVAQGRIADISDGKVPFSADVPLEFTSKPIETQAYLHFNKEMVGDFLTKLILGIRSEIDKILSDLQDQLHTFMGSLFSFNKYQQIHSLAKQFSMSPRLKSLRLAQILKNPLPSYQNITLPSPKTSILIASNFRNDIEHLFNFRCRDDEDFKSIKKQINPEQTKFQSNDQGIVDKNKEKCQTILRKSEVKQQEELSQLWDYILRNCNLNTATKLMGQPLQRFYQHSQDEKQSSVKCCYCSFMVRLKTKSKPQTNSACSYAILEHLYKQHTSNILYQYSLLKGKFSSNSFNLLLQKITDQKIHSIIIIDSSSLFNSKKPVLEEDSFAFQILFGVNKPLFRGEFMRGGNPKDIMLLIGLLIGYAYILCQKKVIIYTSDQRSSTINKACKFYGIENVRAYCCSSIDNSNEEYMLRRVNRDL